MKAQVFESSEGLKAIGPVTGYSRSCLSTSLYLEKYKLLLDVGPLSCYTSKSVDATKILITHFHHDHWSGLISLLGLKKCRDRFDPVHIYVPKGSMWFLKSLLMELRYRRELSIVLTPDPESLMIIQKRIPVVLHPLDGNQTVETSDGLMIETFNSVHRCESIGYKINVKTDDEEKWARLLTYTGDTNVEALEDDILSSRVLITECTYLEPEKTEKAAERGHMSIGNVVDIESRFKGDAMLLIHFKGNYTDSEITNAIKSQDYTRVEPKAICTRISDAE
nr:MBL fold metallo-hydrolase [Candidatus Njordarchaeum guaymaensis]